MATFKAKSEDPCQEIYNNHRRKLERLLDITDDTGKEHWFLLLDTGRKRVETSIFSGERSSIRTDRIRDEVDEFSAFDMESIWLVHSHPNSSALSPGDIWSHYKSSKEKEEYDGTFEVHRTDGEIELSGITNSTEIESINGELLEKKLDRYEKQIKSHYDNDELDLVGKAYWQMFNSVNDIFNICTKG